MEQAALFKDGLTPTAGNEVIAESIRRVLAPLSRLCLVNGISFAVVEEILKQAFIHEAGALQSTGSEHGMVSRVSTSTGISRREVTRLTKTSISVKPVKVPIAAEVFARWTTGSAWQDSAGTPITLRRQGVTPSFEALAQSVTRDVHPRSMLDELIRLGIVQHDKVNDSVTLVRSDFVPEKNSVQMLGFLGDNVGDHLDAAVANVVQNGNAHLEQAIFADELSAESVAVLLPMVTSNWKQLREGMVPEITAAIESDRIAGRLQNQRLRIGLYTFTEADSSLQPDGSAARPGRKLRSRGKCK